MLAWLAALAVGVRAQVVVPTVEAFPVPAGIGAAGILPVLSLAAADAQPPLLSAPERALRPLTRPSGTLSPLRRARERLSPAALASLWDGAGLRRSKEFAAVAERYLSELPDVEPELAGSFGLHGGHDRLAGHDAPSRRLRAAFYRRHLKAVRAIDPSGLPPDDRVDRLLLERRLSENLEAELEGGPPDLESLVSGPLSAISLQLLKAYAPRRERAEAALSRLERLPDVVRQGRRRLRKTSKAERQVVLGQLEAAPATVDELAAGLQRALPSRAKRIGRAAAAAKLELEALRRRVERLPAARRGWAVGRNAFEAALAAHGMPQAAPAFRRRLLAESRRALAGLRDAAEEVRPGRPWKEAVRSVSDHPSEAGLLEAHRRAVAKSERFARRLATMPRSMPTRVLATPEHERAIIPYAAYEGPLPLDRTRTGHVFVTLPPPGLPPKRREAWLSANANHAMIDQIAAHEAVPGHHLQLSRSKRSGSRIRRTFWDVFLGEGWAHYVEGALADAGFFSPEGRLLVEYERYWQLVRARTALGLHAEGWTLERAARHLRRTLGLPRREAADAAVRYAVLDPAESSAYAVGRLELERLRGKERRRLGRRFRLKAFHDRLLSFGGIPLALIEEALAGRKPRRADLRPGL